MIHDTWLSNDHEGSSNVVVKGIMNECWEMVNSVTFNADKI